MAEQFEQAVAAVQDTLGKARAYTEKLVAFGQGNVEALVQSGQIWAAGAQELSRTVAATAQAQVNAGVENAKALAAVKSPKEALDLQTAFVRTSLETAVAEATKLTNASKKLAEDVLAPLTARVKLATEAFTPVA
jgi:phasin family protein